jgi:hypothetical protein
VPHEVVAGGVACVPSGPAGCMKWTRWREALRAFAGLVTCGHCRDAITPEQHVKKSGCRYVD